MLDPRILRHQTDEVRRRLAEKLGEEPPALDEWLRGDEQRRKLLVEVESLKAERNRVSEEISRLKRAKEDASAQIAAMREVGDRIQALDAQVRELDAAQESLLLQIPNLCHESVPVGRDESANVVVRSWGEPPRFGFSPKPHWELAEALDILDPERATRITGVGGVGFTLLKGQGARLMRALMNLMLDLHTGKHGYREVWPPVIVSRASMVGTSQLPKFEEDAYHIAKDDLFLAPTAEVPVTNLHREEILEGERLPLYYAAYSPCFRREAGAAGKDTRGLLRVHQFDKVELVKFCRPETSYEELEKLLADAEEVLQLLEIPYRVVLLCTGDTPFGNAKTYDLEVWAAGVERWLEVSSCSNTEAYQARRAGIRYRPAKGAKPEFAHTLNGSGVAFPRVIAALLENNQQEDGSVRLPEALRGYMGGLEALGAEQ